jgi:membrane protease YdiL (CAAX protease family)
MRSFIRNLTPRGEVFLVFAIWIGLGIINQNIGRHLMPGAPLHGEFSNLGLVTKGIYQLLVLALVFLYIGRIRGWSFASFGFQISWKWTGLGVLLFVPAKLIFVLRRMIVSPNTAGLLAGQIALPIIIISSIIMGIFEELMEVGYIIKVTEKYGMWTAVFISALIRTVLHAYQGAAGMACVLVIGVTFGLVYWKLRQLWPLIVAHILIDIIGSLGLAHHAAS